MTVRLAVFDCDGTLSDGQAAIYAAMVEAFAEAGLTAPDPHAVRRIVGLSLPSAVARLAPDESPEMHASAVAAYKQAFFRARERGLVQEPLFDGVPALLARLLWRAESDPAFYRRLKILCGRRRALFEPEREARSLRRLLGELAAAGHRARQ